MKVRNCIEMCVSVPRHTFQLGSFMFVGRDLRDHIGCIKIQAANLWADKGG